MQGINNRLTRNLVRCASFSFLLLTILFADGCGDPHIPIETSIPELDHIVVVFFENKAADEILDTSAAPYLNAIKNDVHAAYFTNSYAMGHPSQPNYLYFFSGDNQGITNNDRPPSAFNTPNLADALNDAGYSFVCYSEGLPYTGFNGDSSGHYMRKHNPSANWMGNMKYQNDSSTNQPFSNFPSDFDSLPTVSFVVPDMRNSMHDAAIDTGDAWLQENLGAYIEYTKTHNSICIITFDETSYAVTDNKIYTVFIGKPMLQGEFTEPISHISILRTIEDMYHLRHSGYAEFLHGINVCWK